MSIRFTQEIKDKWLAALRSGEYEQGRQKLYRPEDKTYCCLGVLAQIVGVLDPYGHIVPAHGASATYYGPTDVYEWIVLMRKNDQEGDDFDRIADYIEQCVPADNKELRG